jgi:hypothetical protein
MQSLLRYREPTGDHAQKREEISGGAAPTVPPREKVSHHIKATRDVRKNHITIYGGKKEPYIASNSV